MKTKDQKRKEAISRARISWEVNKRAWEKYDTMTGLSNDFCPERLHI